MGWHLGLFCHQFEGVVEHYKWAPHVKAMHLLATLQDRACDVLHRVHKGVTYEEAIDALEDHFGDQLLVTVCHTQLKRRTQLTGESLQEFTITIEQLTRHTLPALSQGHIHWEAGKAFVSDIRDQSMKQQLLLEGERTVSEALKPEGIKPTVESPIRLQKTSSRTFWRSHSPN
jgi:hypothetical protein